MAVSRTSGSILIVIGEISIFYIMCRLVYDEFEKIGEKIASIDATKIANSKEVSLYYEFDNGYEWPLLSF